MLVNGKQIELRRGDKIAAFCQIILETMPETEDDKIDPVVVDRLKKKVISESREIAAEIIGGDILPKDTINQIAQTTAILRLTGEFTDFIKLLMSTPEGRGMLQSITYAAKQISDRK